MATVTTPKHPGATTVLRHAFPAKKRRIDDFTPIQRIVGSRRPIPVAQPMAGLLTCEFSLLSDEGAIESIRRAVKDRAPYSMIRLGDGEAVVLSISDDSSLQDFAYLQGHWGAEGVTLRAVTEVQRDLEQAVRGADLVGVRDDVVNVSLPEDLTSRPGDEVKELVTSQFRLRPDEVDNLSVIGARRLALLHRVLSRIEWTEDQRFCSAWIHWELLATGSLDRILEDATDVGLVTSRPELESLISRRFEVHTRAVIVPDKYVEARESGRHVPERYHTVRSELDFPEGTLVLVGAGIPGKIYCQWLKEAGCVAIDVGSVMDAWVGKASRPRVLESRFNIPGGDRVPADLRLKMPVSSSTNYLTPKWKPPGVSS